MVKESNGATPSCVAIVHSITKSQPDRTTNIGNSDGGRVQRELATDFTDLHRPCCFRHPRHAQRRIHRRQRTLCNL
jgi:hypothetical protein